MKSFKSQGAFVPDNHQQREGAIEVSVKQKLQNS